MDRIGVGRTERAYIYMLNIFRVLSLGQTVANNIGTIDNLTPHDEVGS